MLLIRPTLWKDETNGHLFVRDTRLNQIGYRFRGQQYKWTHVEKVWGPFYRRIGKPFFDWPNLFKRVK